MQSNYAKNGARSPETGKMNSSPVSFGKNGSSKMSNIDEKDVHGTLDAHHHQPHPHDLFKSPQGRALHDDLYCAWRGSPKTRRRTNSRSSEPKDTAGLTSPQEIKRVETAAEPPIRIAGSNEPPSERRVDRSSVDTNQPPHQREERLTALKHHKLHKEGIHHHDNPLSDLKEEEKKVVKTSLFRLLWDFFRTLVALIYGVTELFKGVFSSVNKKELAEAHKKLELAVSYEEWEQAALHIDRLNGRDQWKLQKTSKLYDTQTIEYWLERYRQFAREGDYHAVALALRSGMGRNIGGIANTRLFHYTLVGTKNLIEEYVEEVAKQLEYIAFNEVPGLPLAKKLDFFYELRSLYGKSALLLSGGSTMGLFHIGVIKALYEENLLPQVISGTSAGSFIAALLCVLSDDELEQLFNPPFWRLGEFEDVSFFGKFLRLFKTGRFMDSSQFHAYIRRSLGDVTFREAYDKSKRILNISVAPVKKFETPSLLNYITAPDVLIWSAVCASCALPLAFSAVELMSKDKDGNIQPHFPSHIKWQDGSIGADLPMSRLTELFNINHFIVSQVNPHVAPFLRHTEKKKGGFRSTVLYFLKSELRHRTKQLQELGLIRGFLTMLEPLVTQTYHGDVTLVPPFSLMSYVYLFSAPMEEFIAKNVENGRKNTWPKIPIIKNHCLIEQVLEECCERLQQDVKKGQRESFGYSSQ
eukprot:TRINITY_DN5981_c0_g1_i1.p1 TRINITY_DN5981_c0_g1~~TRINITY_DN5981_c0_g1_i1.p1  ORF type:complete len:697 (+),score=203.74 TRINITY_DN5981_c0_g1_i1:172-2262(+)